MYKFYYQYLKPTYGARCRLLFTDTDTLWWSLFAITGSTQKTYKKAMQDNVTINKSVSLDTIVKTKKN